MIVATMSAALDTLISFAVSVFQEKTDPKYMADVDDAGFTRLSMADAVMNEAQRQSMIMPKRHPALSDVERAVFSEPELEQLAPRDGVLDPMILYAGGGFRTSPRALTMGLLSSAFLQIYYQRLPMQESTFVETVVQNFEELKRAVRGERVRALRVFAIARIALKEGALISTPWGLIRPAPPVQTPHLFGLAGWPATTCLLIYARLLPLIFDRAASPQPPPPESDTPWSRAAFLFPLACALATKNTATPVAPLMTWSTEVLPFQVGFTYFIPPPTGIFTPPTSLDDSISHVEKWATMIDRSHVPSVEIAARRLVSAIGNRIDRSDALIDAVIVWENLVGTSTEVTFRVTAAIAKLLESDVDMRRSLRKRLLKAYRIRSRVVHGAAVAPRDIDEACADAIEIAVRMLQAGYSRGPEWLALTSEERSDRILLE